MEKKTKIIIGVSALVVVGGIILLGVSNKKKKKIASCTAKGGAWDKATKSCVDPATNEIIDISSETNYSSDASGGGITSGGGGSSRPSTGFTSKSEGDAFRVWVNATYPLYAKSIFLDKSGDYDNSYIRKAYEKYGSEYKSASSSPHLLVAKYLGNRASRQGNRTTVKFNYDKNIATFYSNGTFSIATSGQSGLLAKGNYLNGGKILIIKEGAKAGKTFKDVKVWKNLFKTI